MLFILFIYQKTIYFSVLLFLIVFFFTLMFSWQNVYIWRRYIIFMIWLICSFDVGTRRESHCLDMVMTSGKAIGSFISTCWILCGKSWLLDYFLKWLNPQPYIIKSQQWPSKSFHNLHLVSSISEHPVCFIIGRIDKAMEGLKIKLQTAYKASGGRKVNIISHSMGGLLVSCFMSLYNDVRKIYLGD